MKYQLPDNPTSHQLDNPEEGFWSIVVPQADKNYFFNPSVESIQALQISTFTHGFTFSEVVKSSDHASHGFYSLKVVPDLEEDEIQMHFFESPVGWHRVSFDLYASIGQQFTLEITASGGTPIYARQEIVPQKEGWQRYSIRFYQPSVQTLGYVARLENHENNVGAFYLDGLHVGDVDAEFTYFDGDFQEDSFDSNPYAFTWKGQPHLSISSVSGRVHKTGKIVNLDELGFITTAIVGLGMIDPELDLVSLSDGEEISKGSIVHGKDFSIVGRIYAPTPRELAQKRQSLINYLNILNSHSGLLTLGYQPSWGKRLWMTCSFVGGLAGNTNNHHQDNLELRFRLFNGKVYEEFGDVAALGTNISISTAGLAYRNSNTGEWITPGGGAANGVVNAAVVMDDGSLVVGGAFTSIGGVSARRIAHYDPSTGVWSEFDDGFNGEVLVITKYNGSAVYSMVAAGSFTANGPGTTPMARIAIYNTNLGFFQELGDGLNNTVRDVKVAPNGIVYAVGDFTQTGGAGLARSFVKFNELTDALWVNLIATSITGGFPTTLELSPDNSKVYIGGGFSAINGDTTLRCVAQWNIASTSFTAMESGLSAQVNDLAMAPDGYLYMVGDFLLTGGGTARQMRRIARWNGSSFEEIGGGEINVVMHRLAFDRRGNLYVTGASNEDGNYDSVSTTNLFQWNGAAWVSSNVRSASSSTPALGQVLVLADGTLVLTKGGSTDVKLSAHTTVTCEATADTPVCLTVVGSAYVHRISNWTTGQHIYFKALRLVAGEQLFLDLTGTSPRAWTNFRPNVLDQIVVGVSDLDFHLLPGENHITTMITGVVAATQCVMSWNNHHWSIDAS